MTFRLPNGTHRTVIIGPTGSGKTIGGAWVLSCQDFNKRPWIIFDYKGEELWDRVGDPPLRPIRVGRKPDKKGLYVASIRPDQDEAVEDWLWKIWEWENIGLFCDEVSLLPRKKAFQGILRQGRSKRIPVISCTQRPVDCEREVFSEASFRMLYGVEDTVRDYPVIKGLFGGQDVSERLPKYWSWWYDAEQRECLKLRPVPPPDSIASRLKEAAPYNWFLGG